MNNYENIEFLNSPITTIKGVGPKKKELFSKLGINSVLDLLYYLPRSYEDRRTIKKISKCISGELCCIKVIPLRQVVEKRLKNKLSLFLLYATDGETQITAKWFSAPFSKPKLKSHTEYIIYGKMICGKNGNEFELRYIEEADNMKYTGCIVPIYHSTNGLSSKTISDTIYNAYMSMPEPPECFPAEFIEKHNL